MKLKMAILSGLFIALESLLLIEYASAVQSQKISKFDWIVTGVEVVENQDIILSGPLEIKANASLTLKNITLTLNQAGINMDICVINLRIAWLCSPLPS